MLFKRLFNWLKFKTIPASILYKNRLFIERDSKNRRVMTNFGLTFRNSKWADYSTTNVSTNSRSLFARFISTCIRLLILLISFIIGFTLGYTNVEISFFFEMFWFIVDLTTSYFAFWTGILTAGLHLLWAHMWTQILSYIYGTSTKTPLNDVKLNTIAQNLGGDMIDHGHSVSKDSCAKIARNWIVDGTEEQNTSDDMNQHSLVMKYLTKSHEVKQGFYHTQHKVHQQLYKQLYHSLKLMRVAHMNPVTLISNCSQPNRTVRWFSDIQLFKINQLETFFNLTLNFKEKHESSPLYTLDEKLTNCEWNLHSFGNELTKVDYAEDALIWQQGTFYLFNQDFNKLNRFGLANSEYVNFSTALTDQLNILKWSRWLYRYNILHRKLIDNSHKITNTKKLVSNGFYDSRLMSHNLWASNFFSQKQNKRLLKTQTNALYGDVFGLNKKLVSYYQTLGTTSLNKGLSHLSFYEKSYFFFLHRFQLLNRMVNLNISSNHIPSKSKNINLSDNLNYTTSVNRQLLDTTAISMKAAHEEFYLLRTDSQVKDLLDNTKVLNDKGIWKEENFNSTFSLDSSNLFVNLSELSDLTPNGILAYNYTQQYGRSNTPNCFQWRQSKTFNKSSTK